MRQARRRAFEPLIQAICVQDDGHDRLGRVGREDVIDPFHDAGGTGMHPSGGVVANTDHFALAHMLPRLHARLDKPPTPPERDRQLDFSDRDRGNRRGVG
ncbi:hypothetical protein D3C72_1984960 [compost metagenome]